MSSTVFWILVASVIIALVVMIVSFVVMRIKIENVKNQFLSKQMDNSNNPALAREDNGMLLWDLKEKTKNPLEDSSMTFAINTIIRNGYSTVSLFGFDENYELESLKNIVGVKIVKDNFDFSLVKYNENLVDEIDSIFKKANNSAMIMIVDYAKKKRVKDLLSHLKYTGIRHEKQKIDSGIILIAK